MASYQRKMTKYDNARVRKKSFKKGDLVLRKVFLSSREPSMGTLGGPLPYI